MKDYEHYLDRLERNSIDRCGQLCDIICGLKELSGKLDTIIALKQVELSRLQPQQEPQSRKETS